jgi:hypothetical protein
MDRHVEVWLPASGTEGVYEVSNLGRIRRADRGNTLTPTFTSGYAIVSLSLGGVTQNVRLHRLVLSSFCGAPPFEGAFACHNNGDTRDNALTNLRWATPKENQQDSIRHGTRPRGEDIHNAVLTADQVREIRAEIASGSRNPPLAERYGVSISTIHLIRHKRIWRHAA